MPTVSVLRLTESRLASQRWGELADVVEPACSRLAEVQALIRLREASGVCSVLRVDSGAWGSRIAWAS